MDPTLEALKRATKADADRATSELKHGSDQGTRAYLMLQSEQEAFLRRLGLRIIPPERATAGITLELPIASGLASWLGAGFVTQHVATTDGSPPSDDQAFLALAHAQLIARLIVALRQHADEIADAGIGLEDACIARYALWRSRGPTDDPAELQADTDRAGYIFLTRLLQTLRNLMLRSYEGKPASAAVAVVASGSAFRFTGHIQEGLPLLAETKIGRKLTGQGGVMAVFSWAGEFFGLHEGQAVQEKERHWAEFHVKRGPTLEVRIGNEPCLLLRDGQWRYIDRDRIFERATAEEPSLAGPNRRLRDIATTLSEIGEGGLLLVVRDLGALVKDQVAASDQLNLPGEKTRIEAQEDAFVSSQSASHPDKESLRRPRIAIGMVKLDPKSYLLEQFRAKKVEEIPVSILVRLAAVDGATLVDCDGNLLGFGIVLQLHGQGGSDIREEGARTVAARMASLYGLAIKISSDGPIELFSKGKKV